MTRGRTIRIGYKRAGTAAHGEVALVAQDGIRLVHSMEVHSKVARERAHRGKGVTGRKLPRGDGLNHLRANLPVDRLFRHLVNHNGHAGTPFEVTTFVLLEL